MRIPCLLALALAAGPSLAGCASTRSDKEVSAVVQSESARQAAATTAQSGDGSQEALEAGADAAPAAATAKTEPPAD